MEPKIELKKYTPKELAKKLIIQPVTLRKYSQLLEKQGVVFDKDNQEHRIYYEHDFQNFYYLCDLRKQGIALDTAIEQVALLYRQNIAEIPNATAPQDVNLMAELIKYMQEENAALKQEVKQTNELLEKVLYEMQATRSEIAAIKEQQIELTSVNLLPQPEEKLKEPKKWWQKLLE